MIRSCNLSYMEAASLVEVEALVKGNHDAGEVGFFSLLVYAFIDLFIHACFKHATQLCDQPFLIASPSLHLLSACLSVCLSILGRKPRDEIANAAEKEDTYPLKFPPPPIHPYMHHQSSIMRHPSIIIEREKRKISTTTLATAREERFITQSME